MYYSYRFGVYYTIVRIGLWGILYYSYRLGVYYTIVRIGFWGIFYYSYDKEPPK